MRLSPAAREALRQAKVDGAHVVLQGQLDPKLYREVNKALESLGGKWNRKQKAHVFATNPEGAIRAVADEGEVVVPRDDFDYFPCSEDVAEHVLTRVKASLRKELHRGRWPWPWPMGVLEPSAGDGMLVRATRRAFPEASITAVEVQERFRAELEAVSNDVHIGDFLSWTARTTFDVVVMNPPFSGNLAIPHVEKAFEHLRSGGRLVAVLPASVTFRTTRAWSKLRERFEGIEPLPDGSFKDAGTGVRAVVAWATKA